MKMLREILEEPRVDGFRVVEFSIQRDHLHLVVEADDKRTLSSGVRSLVIRFAKRLNHRILKRAKGRVWADRYHRRDLTTPRQTRNALAYILGNYKKHGLVACDAPTIDPFSSAPWFNGWAPHVRLLRPLPEDEPSTHPARTWLLAVGWREKHGPLDPNTAPAKSELVTLATRRAIAPG